MNYLKSFFYPNSSTIVPIVNTSIDSSPIEELLKKIDNKDPLILKLSRIGDGHIRASHPINQPNIKTREVSLIFRNETILKPIFNHEILIVDNWDKNGVFYNLDSSMFPNVKNIIMMSHPCEYSVLFRFKDCNWILPYNIHRWFKEKIRTISKIYS
jgi:hypothetical protein